MRPTERPRALEAARPGREFRLGSRAALCAVVMLLGPRNDTLTATAQPSSPQKLGDAVVKNNNAVLPLIRP